MDGRLLLSSDCALSHEVRSKFPLAMSCCCSESSGSWRISQFWFSGWGVSIGNLRLYEEFPASLEAQVVFFQGKKQLFSYSANNWKIDVSSSIGHMPSWNVRHKAGFCWGPYIGHWGWLSWLNVCMWAWQPEFEPLYSMEERNLDMAVSICNPSQTGKLSRFSERLWFKHDGKNSPGRHLIFTFDSVCTCTYSCAGVHTGVCTHTFTFPTKCGCS